jgi:hypothetical protein
LGEQFYILSYYSNSKLVLDQYRQNQAVGTISERVHNSEKETEQAIKTITAAVPSVFSCGETSHLSSRQEGRVP